MKSQLTPEVVIERCGELPAFPGVVSEILAAIDDDNSTIGLLAKCVERDPVLAGKVMSMACAAQEGSGVRIKDVYGAISRIGLGRTREAVIEMSLVSMFRSSRCPVWFWEHSVAVSVAAQELARQVQQLPDFALVAGLLHDIGQLWLARFRGETFSEARLRSGASGRPISTMEQAYFGMTHGEIGAVIAGHWQLPSVVVDAIAGHHNPGMDISPLAAVTHVAEVMVNALNVCPQQNSQVSYLSGRACELLGLDWGSDLTHMFGRIEARTAHTCQVFRQAA